MPGLQLASFWEGNRAELFATYVLSGIASVAGVPHQFDVGVDLLCTLMRRQENALYAGRSFGVQVKSGPTEFRYGGISDKGVWRKYELKWLYSQDAPLLFGVVDLHRWSFRLYSPTRMWWVLFKYFWPGEIVLVPDEEPPVNVARNFPREPLTAAPADCGDGHSHRVPMGKPLVEVVLAEEETFERKEQIRSCIDAWLKLELRNIRHYQMNIPYTVEWSDWETNVSPSVVKNWHYISDIPGQHISQILTSIGPAIASLHHQLRRQNEPSKLAQVQPMCDLMRGYGFRDPSLPQAAPDGGEIV